MGEAKRRGTLEQRRQQAIEKAIADRQLRREAEAIRPRRKSNDVLGLIMAATVLGLGSN